MRTPFVAHLLRDFRPESREEPTVAGPRRVRDVASHLLDGDTALAEPLLGARSAIL